MPNVYEHEFEDAQFVHHVAYNLAPIRSLAGTLRQGVRVLDIGSGNGSLAGWFQQQGCTVVGIEPSKSGVTAARKAYPDVRFVETVIRPNLLEELQEEPFDIVVSTEVVEHLYAPREWASSSFDALKPGGILIGTTPYHGYLKNLLITLTGKFDKHTNPLWDGGHIKFWSPSTLRRLFEGAGFVDITWTGSGRLPLLYKSMVMRGTRPRD